MPPQRVVLLDTCVLINLVASGHVEDVVGTADEEFAICSAVEDESVFLRSQDPQSPQEPVQVQSLVQSGLLRVCQLEAGEEAMYVGYASQLDDGEAMSLAIAHSRGFILATDDRKARRLFQAAVNDPARLVSTSGILRAWSKRSGTSHAELKAALSQVSLRARFFPPSDDSHYQWWCEVCGS